MAATENTGSRGQAAPAFLEKLFALLSDASNQSSIAWQPEGTSFLIKQVAELQDRVLPTYFKHNNLQSFVRQLNMYGFVKTVNDPNFREFKNSNFLRGRRDLLPLIKRKVQAGLREERGVSSATSGTTPRPAKVLDMDIEDGGTLDLDEGAKPHATRTNNRKKTSAYRPASQTSFLSANQPYTRGLLEASDWLDDNIEEGDYDVESSVPTFQSAEISSLLATTNELRWRVRQLETSNTLLLERYSELAGKHDELINILHRCLSSSGAISIDSIFESRMNRGGVSRRRSCSDLSNGGCESIAASSGAATADDYSGNHVGSIDSTSSRFPETDSDHASESDGVLGSKKAASPDDAGKEEPHGKKYAKHRDNEVNLENICDSPTYHAANILLRARSSNERPTLDSSLSNFVDAIASIWTSTSSASSSVGMHSQFATPSMHDVHGISIKTDVDGGSFAAGISSLASPILVSRPQHSLGLVPSAMTDLGMGAGVGYGNLAGKPISKQVSMPASFDHSKKRTKSLHSVSSYCSDQPLQAPGLVEGESRASFSSSRGLEGRAISRQKSI